MKVRTIGILSLIGAMSMSAAWAGPAVKDEPAVATGQQVSLNQLEARRTQVGQQEPEPPKGAAVGHWLSKKVQLDDVISRLKKGESVSPNDIDQAMQP